MKATSLSLALLIAVSVHAADDPVLFRAAFDSSTAATFQGQPLTAAKAENTVFAEDALVTGAGTLLWGKTTVSQNWIADQLQMGSAANVSQQIRRWNSAGQAPKLPSALRSFINVVQKMKPDPSLTPISRYASSLDVAGIISILRPAQMIIEDVMANLASLTGARVLLEAEVNAAEDPRIVNVVANLLPLGVVENHLGYAGTRQRDGEILHAEEALQHGARSAGKRRVGRRNGSRSLRAIAGERRTASASGPPARRGR